MRYLFTRSVLLAAFAAMAFGTLSVASRPAAAEGFHRVRAAGDLFYNYYVGPTPPVGGIPAQLYPAPVPTPPFVGHTYITYPALMPHELLYRHHRHYYRHNPGGGWNHTKVSIR
jgi:hypothetical protein